MKSRPCCKCGRASGKHATTKNGKAYCIKHAPVPNPYPKTSKNWRQA